MKLYKSLILPGEHFRPFILFTADHCVEQHYSFQIRRCHDEECCPTPGREWDWVPDPILDVTGQHYKPFEELLGKETTEKDMPSGSKQTVAAVAQEQQVRMFIKTREY